MHKTLYIPAIILLVTTIALELLNIHLSGLLASNSVTVKKMQINIAKLNEENQILKTQVLTETSFETVASRASELGFVQNNNYISLRQQNLSYSQ